MITSRSPASVWLVPVSEITVIGLVACSSCAACTAGTTILSTNTLGPASLWLSSVSATPPTKIRCKTPCEPEARHAPAHAPDTAYTARGWRSPPRSTPPQPPAGRRGVRYLAGGRGGPRILTKIQPSRAEIRRCS
ncbi:hypothetical protein C8R44DRAFT_772984 [Mycena epipterygia]|nr:hypothetical protein C8R44DRAFT_772984 [Mycena epipterygia]